MPTLNWIGKEAVVNHHHQVPFHLLKDVPDLACGEPGDGNLIVQGDNLVALRSSASTLIRRTTQVTKTGSTTTM
jgi:adenine-specific DNA-methyltransferase